MLSPHPAQPPPFLPRLLLATGAEFPLSTVLTPFMGDEPVGRVETFVYPTNGASAGGPGAVNLAYGGAAGYAYRAPFDHQIVAAIMPDDFWRCRRRHALSSCSVRWLERCFFFFFFFFFWSVNVVALSDVCGCAARPLPPFPWIMLMRCVSVWP